jgi:hypothetical protein
MSEEEKKPAAEQPADSENEKQVKGNWNHFMPKGSANTSKMFEGRCNDLKGYIYDCANTAKAADMYTKTTREIIEYIGCTFKYSSDLVKGMESLVEPKIEEPEELPKDATALEKQKWDKRVDKLIDQKKWLKDATSQAYAIVWGQCSDALREKVKAHKDFSKAHKGPSGVLLLKVIKTEMFTFQTQKYRPQALHEAKKQFYMMRQEKYTSVQSYYESFMNTVKVIKHCGGDIGTDRSLVDKMLGGREWSIASASIIIDAEHLAKEKYLACAFVMGADKTRYG